VKPLAPVVGVGGVVVRDGRALLVRRGKPPLYGRWVVPGGTVELGETLEEALVREIREETGLDVEPVEVLTVFDRIERDGDEVAYHYVIVDYLCRWQSGEASSSSDALDVAWVRREDMAGYDVPPKAMEVVEDALHRAARGWTAGPGALRADRGGPILGPVSTRDPEGT
jgi:ADP-ribose pyrophosphatase YjhB (NUDIX family)